MHKAFLVLLFFCACILLAMDCSFIDSQKERIPNDDDDDDDDDDDELLVL